MLSGLYIENIAVIQKAGIDFERGLNVLTGETGAGKSIVIDSINAVLGERTSRDIVRTGSDNAKVTAVFSAVSAACAKKLEELGYPLDEDGNLLIQRVISAEGKGSCRINGQPVTVSLLRDIGRLLVNIHGQHENQALLSPERHLDYLERMGNLADVRTAYYTSYRKWRELSRELEQTGMDEGEKARHIDILRYQIDEIRTADLKPGEMDELAERREMYRNSEKIAISLGEAREALSGGDDYDGILSMLYNTLRNIGEAERYMPGLTDLTERMQSARYELEECAEELRNALSELDFEPNVLEHTESRIDSIRRAISKYGADEQAALKYLENAEQELENIELSDERTAELEKSVQQAKCEMHAHAGELTAARKKAAKDFSENVGEQLAFLAMPGVRLEVTVEPRKPDSTGADRVEFLISANPGEPPKSISKIASGGELSRIMLAIKSVMADADDIDTLIFDEIDAGISGHAAQRVGQKLRETAAGRQVLCVTHLATIAVQAHSHYLIEKKVTDGRTFTDVIRLEENGRIRELARIIDGEGSPAAMDAAREMIARV